jgi:YVTN family beta-propeller protein
LLALAAGLLAARPAAAIEIEELDRYIFVANRTSAEIAVIDARSDRVVERLDLGTKPEGFLLSGSLGLLVAAHPEEQRISILDLAS